MAQLYDLVSRQEEAVSAGDYLQYLAHDRQFHPAVASLSQNPYLKRAIATMQLQGHRFLVLDRTVRARVADSLGEHRRLARAIDEAQADTAADLALRHVERTQKTLGDVLPDGEGSRGRAWAAQG